MVLTRRAAGKLLAGSSLTAALSSTALSPALAQEKSVKIGINFSLTGADAESAKRIRQGAILAIEEANAKKMVPGYKLEEWTLDDATATAGQYDPAQAATNARKFASDRAVVAAIGPQMSGAGKAMAPILSQANLAIISPASTNPDLTDPKFAAQYRPGGKPVYFRTVTTDAYQGPNMANFFASVLKAKSIYILDDSGAFGVGIADSFEAQAKKKGMQVLGRDRLDPKAADYTAILTKVKALNPQGLYYGGVGQEGVKVVKQSHEIIPNVIKGAGDGMYIPEMLTAAGFPAAEGWYCSIAAPHFTAEDQKTAEFFKRYKARFNMDPEDYSVTCYSATLVAIDAIRRVAATGKPVTREAVRDAIHNAKVQTPMGLVQFDANGDLTDRTVSVFQVKKNGTKPLDSMADQWRYVGVAPQA
jgi:branched-chain amino acid transport system substrate-binding protein